MKKGKGLVTIFLFVIILFGTPVFSSVKTYERTQDNYGVDESIKVTYANKKDILDTPYVDANEKVYDFANLLSDSEEKLLFEDISEYIKNNNMDMVIVTINENNKSDAMHYADDFYDYNNFGVGKNHDGILFLIDMDTREMWISTCGNAILVYDDNRIDNMLDATYNYISKQKYYSCALAFIDEADSYAKSGIPKSNYNYKIDENGNYVKTTSKEPFSIVPVLFFSIVATITFVIVNVCKHKVVAKATQAKEYLVKDSFKLNDRDDKFINSYTSKTYSPRSSSSGGGSSTHSSSSGRSHGGGGRRF